MRYQTEMNNRGETTVQAVLLVPIVMTIFFLAAHVATLARAGHIAQAVSLRGAQMASSNFGPQGIATSLNEMEKMATDLGTQLTSVPRLTVTDRNATVTISLHVASVVPFLQNSISRTSSVPLEIFLLEGDRR